MKTALSVTSCLVTLGALTACAAAGGATVPDNPQLSIPSYPADDPRPQTGGFVREVRLAETARGDTRFTLMAFQVGDTLTLGAMTQGPFEGSANWRLGNHGIGFDFAADHGEVTVTTTNPPTGATELRGQQAGFRDFRWINVELEVERWLDGDETLLGLRFRDRTGEVTELPADGSGAYSARIEPR